MVPNPTVAEAFAQNMRALGLQVVEPAPDERMGSTDMGDISQLMPAVHAYFAIGPEDLPGHSIGFAEAAAGPAGDVAVINGAKALGMTVADLLAAPGMLERAQAEYRQMLDLGQVAGWDRWHADGALYNGAPV
jgi:metal-dependent amidase/aminoacylase/carboxypeptidase family protein